MRDLYQDAEIEANKREGEARAQRIMDTVGEDEPMINPHPSSSPMHPSGSNQSLDSNDPLKKANKKVKHCLKKLKDAFHKLTPSLMHSSPNRSGSVSPSYKHYSTALHGKTPKELGPNQVTVSRASSRTLPNQNLTQLLRGESRSAETVTSVSRRASLMPQPQSHYSSSNRNLDGLDPRLLNQFRSTSLDHSRQPIPLTPPSPTSPDRSVPLSTTKDSRQNTQTLTVRVPSDLSSNYSQDGSGGGAATVSVTGGTVTGTICKIFEKKLLFGYFINNKETPKKEQYKE
ncbi:hypothetical protein BY996DRAFT_8560477 [Phakopsora pachyrhizi]|nr:hypothetical protein BY996DRAFT_8560477 [Phakopsora pachyrhizi]